MRETRAQRFLSVRVLIIDPNGRLPALFPEVTHKDFFRSELEYTVGFDREEIQLSLISPWEKFVAYR